MACHTGRISCLWCAVPMAAAAQESSPWEAELPEGFEKITQNDRFALVLNEQNCAFGVVSRESGNIWWSNPQNRPEEEQVTGKFGMEMQSQITIRYVNVNAGLPETANSAAQSVRKNTFEIKRNRDGFTLSFTFSFSVVKTNPKGTFSFLDFILALFGKKSDKEMSVGTDYAESKIVVPLSISLTETGIRAEIKDEDLQESDDIKLLDIGILPYFFAGAPEEEGYVLLPDGCGAVMEFHNGKTTGNAYEGKIYGRNYAISSLEKSIKETPVPLPVYGIRKQDSSMLALITDSAVNASIIAKPDGMETPFACSYAQYRIRSSDTYRNSSAALNQTFEMFNLEKRETQDICEEFVLLDQSDVGLAEMADITADAIGNTQQKSDVSALLNVTGAIYPKDNIMGIPVNKKRTLTTFEECADMIRTLAPDFPGEVAVRYQNWTQQGIKQQMQNSLKPDGGVGGQKGMDHLLNTGVQAYFDVTLNTYKRGGLFSDWSKAARTIYRSNATIPEYYLSVYMIDGSKLPNTLVRASVMEENADTILEGLEKFSGTGISLGGLSTYVYGDYHADNIVTPSEMVDIYEGIYQDFNEKTAVMADAANFYALQYTNLILRTPTISSGHPVFSYDVPFYQMVVSRFAVYGGCYLNKSASPQTEFLKGLSYGALPSFDFIAQDTTDLQDTEYSYLSGSLFSKHADTAKEWIDCARGLYEEIGDRTIEDFSYISQGVTCTTFRSGERLLVNLSDTVYDGEASLPAKSFILLEEVGER